MLILGIDPGSHRIGYGLVADDHSCQRVMASGTWIAPSKATFLVRANYLHEQLFQVMASHRPEILVLEEAFSGAYPQAGLQLAQIRGLCLAQAFQRSIKIIEYAPRKVKQMVTGSGTAEKSQVAFMVQRRFHLDALPQEDEADALALCLAYSQMKTIHSLLENSSIDKCIV